MYFFIKFLINYLKVKIQFLIVLFSHDLMLHKAKN